MQFSYQICNDTARVKTLKRMCPSRLNRDSDDPMVAVGDNPRIPVPTHHIPGRVATVENACRGGHWPLGMNSIRPPPRARSRVNPCPAFAPQARSQPLLDFSHPAGCDASSGHFRSFAGPCKAYCGHPFSTSPKSLGSPDAATRAALVVGCSVKMAVAWVGTAKAGGVF